METTTKFDPVLDPIGHFLSQHPVLTKSKATRRQIHLARFCVKEGLMNFQGGNKRGWWSRTLTGDLYVDKPLAGIPSSVFKNGDVVEELKPYWDKRFGT